MKLTIINKVCAALLFCHLSALCIWGASVEELATKADAIVLGTVTTRTEGQGIVSFDISPERILKGTGPLNARVVHQWSGKLAGPAQKIDVPLHGIWFLVRSSASEWDVLTVRPTWHGLISGLYFPVSALSADYQYQPGSPLLDVLTFEVAAGLESTGDTSGILTAIGSSNTVSAQTVLNHLLNSPSASSQLVGLSGALSRGQMGL